jgi:serine/threonine protein kinase
MSGGPLAPTASLPPEAHSPEVGQVLPGTKYLLLSKLGEGGMGVVYEVLKPPEIAGVLKRMSLDLARSSRAKAMFLAETSILAQLDHPNIVRVYDFDEDAFGVPFFVMERLMGRTVRDLLVSRGRVRPAEAYEITRQLLEALHAAHTHDTPVVHRDVKPENIFLHQPKHGAAALKLIDFGIVADAGEKAGEFVGTIDYAAPEQLFGQRVTAKADLYAVASVLYEMLSGRLPFPGKTLAETGAAKGRGAFPPLRSLVPELPEAVAALVARALSKDPAARPASARHFRDLLDAAIATGEGPSATKVPAFTRPGVAVEREAAGARSDAAAYARTTLEEQQGGRLVALLPSIAAGVVTGAALLAALHWTVTRH